MLIRLIKPGKGVIVAYEGQVIERGPTWVAVATAWEREALDLGLLRFEPGDPLVEYFYSDRWYNVFQLHSVDGTLKGWYCNVTRPAVITADMIESEDLELDLLVSADRTRTRLDDEDEFLARDLDAETYARARQTIIQLQELIARGESPFNAEC